MNTLSQETIQEIKERLSEMYDRSRKATNKEMVWYFSIDFEKQDVSEVFTDASGNIHSHERKIVMISAGSMTFTPKKDYINETLQELKEEARFALNPNRFYA